MKNRVTFFISLLFILISPGCGGDETLFSYEELVEIYVYTAYIGDSNIELVQEYLGEKYNIGAHENQIKYSKSLKAMAKTREKWNLFIKDTVDFYIKIKKELSVQFYHSSGYDKQINRFNDNFLLDPKNPLPKDYWKVSSLVENKKKLNVIHIKDLYKGGKLWSRTYFEHHHQKIKEIHYSPKEKVTYYQDNIPLLMPGKTKG